MTVAFWVTTLVIVATPGTGVLYTVAAALARGARAGVVAAVGCTLGIVPHLIAAVTGLAAVMHTSASAFQSLKYLGVAYLLYLSWLTFADRGELTVEQEQPVRSAPRVIASGVAVNLLNPKLTIFFFAFLPQFVRADQTRPALQMLELSGVFMLVTFVVFAGYGVLAASFRERVRSRPRSVIWLRRAFAGSYAALACRLALTQR